MEEKKVNRKRRNKKEKGIGSEGKKERQQREEIKERKRKFTIGSLSTARPTTLTLEIQLRRAS